MKFLSGKPAPQTPVERIQAVIEELAKLEIDLPQKQKTMPNLRGLQSAKGILRSLSFRL